MASKSPSKKITWGDRNSDDEEVPQSVEPEKEWTKILKDNKWHEWCNASTVGTKAFSFDGQKILAFCTAVYDGDTITVEFPCFKTDELKKFKIRLHGIDTPELRSSDEAERKAAFVARDTLRSIVLDDVVLLDCHSFDKYGRILADVYAYDASFERKKRTLLDEAPKVDVCSWLLEKGLAVPYDGKAKRGQQSARGSSAVTRGPRGRGK